MKVKLPKKYVPKGLSKKDAIKQAKMIMKTMKAYKKGKYLKRTKLKSAKTKKSSHVQNAKRIYGLASLVDAGKEGLDRFKTLAKKAGCAPKELDAIYKKGAAAWMSGSRPNQTQASWGIARVASAVTGGKSSVVDKQELLRGCKRGSKAIKYLKRTLKRTKGKLKKTQKREILV